MAQGARQFRLFPLVMGYQGQGEGVMEELAPGIIVGEALWGSQSMGQTPYRVVDQFIGGICPPVAALQRKVQCLDSCVVFDGLMIQ